LFDPADELTMGLPAKPIQRELAAGQGAGRRRPEPALDEGELAAFACDLALISDQSTPAEALIAAAAEHANDASIAQVLWHTFERLRQVYHSGGIVAHPARVRALLRKATVSCGVDPAGQPLGPLLALFDRVNRALFLHQTLDWLSGSDLNLKIRLYGTGWEQHPAFASLARGAIQSPAERQAIWRASRIHLAANVYGAPTGAVLEAVAGGAFFLLRFCPADVIERFYPVVADFCGSRGITSTLELRRQAPPDLRRLLGYASRTLGMDIVADWPEFIEHALQVTSSGHARGAASLWSSCYPAVCFSSRDELLGLCTRYLYDGPERQRLAQEMRSQLAASASRVTVTVNDDLVPRLAPTAA
jgi:hypothetical protein